MMRRAKRRILPPDLRGAARSDPWGSGSATSSTLGVLVLALGLAVGPAGSGRADDVAGEAVELEAAEPVVPPEAPAWEFGVSPYLWLPHLTGKAAAGFVGADVGTSFWDIIGGGLFPSRN